MFVQNKVKVGALMIGLFIVLLLAGCITPSSDNTKIIQIGKNIEKAIEEKDGDLFMQNISYDYSDPNGGTYDNHINNLPENIISQIELAEDLIGSIPGLKIVIDVSIPSNSLIIVEPYATGKMEINISLKACVAWVVCTTLYNENMEYNVDFIKEDDDEWKIISLEET